MPNYGQYGGYTGGNMAPGDIQPGQPGQPGQLPPSGQPGTVPTPGGMDDVRAKQQARLRARMRAFGGVRPPALPPGSPGAPLPPTPTPGGMPPSGMPGGNMPPAMPPAPPLIQPTGPVNPLTPGGGDANTRKPVSNPFDRNKGGGGYITNY